MDSPGKFRCLIILALFSFCVTFSASSIRAQNKVELALCEDLKIQETQIGVSVIETATCVNPTTAFKPKGTLRNVFMVATFSPIPTGAGFAFITTKNDAAGEFVDTQYAVASALHKTVYAKMTLNTPGKYFVRLVNYYAPTQVFGSQEFTVSEDTVGPRATANTAAGRGKLTFCKEVDDDWKPVAASNEWKANVPFNILFENPEPAGVDFIGIVIHKQDAKGRDVEFVNEYQQNMGEKNRKYATVGDELRLPAGTYSVYIIDWRKREVSEHRGNLTEYFAKNVLTVK